MKSVHKVFWMTILAFIGSGCAVKVKLPANHLVTPETSGKPLGGQVDFRAYGVADIQVIDDRFSATPDTTPSQIENSAIGAGASLGIFERLDLYAYAGNDSPVYAGVKLQLLGDGTEKAKRGNFALAIAGAAALSGGKESSTENSIESEIERKYSGYVANVVVGFRPADSLLVYGGPFASEVETDVAVTRTVASAASTTADVKGMARQKGASIGLRLGGGAGLYALIEGSYTETTYKRTEPSTAEAANLKEQFLGGSLGLTW